MEQRLTKKQLVWCRKNIKGFAESERVSKEILAKTNEYRKLKKKIEAEVVYVDFQKMA